MNKARQNLAALGALAPVALGCALFDASAADARMAKIDGLRQSGEGQHGKTTEAAELGRAYLKGGDTVRALEQYRQALAGQPDDIDTMNGIAVCYDRLGQFEVSRAYYEAALGMQPQSPMLLNNYGYSLFLQGDLAGARRFLTLAATSGDTAVENAALRLLARIDTATARAPAAGAMPARTSPAQASRFADADATGPRIVRTSNHEQRLMLGGIKAPPTMLASLGAEAAAVAAPVTRFTEAEEQAIFVQEERLVRAEAVQRLAELQRETAVPSEPILPSEMQAMLAVPRIPAAGDSMDFAGYVTPDTIGGIAALPGHVVAETDGSVSKQQHLADRNGPRLAILPAGLLVQRSSARPTMASILPAAEPIARKRSFDSPFQSDLEALNGFAARLHGQTQADEGAVAVKLALLQDLIDRTRPA